MINSLSENTTSQSIAMSNPIVGSDASVHPMGSGTMIYLENSSDFDFYNYCQPTAMAMYIDYLGRRIDPGLLYGRPMSTSINNIFNTILDGSFGDQIVSLRDYLNSYKLSSKLSFTVNYLDNNDHESSGGGPTSEQIFSKHKERINLNMPTLVEYTDYSSVGHPSFSHIMLGIGYEDSGFYIVRDTWGKDSNPIDDDFFYSTGLRDYALIWAQYTDSDPSHKWGSVTLRTGDSGEQVRMLENMLYVLYYEAGPYDGVFDTSLLNAVKAFQADNGLSTDGVVGTNTFSKLKLAHMFKYDSTIAARTLSVGKKGDDVAQLQCRLKGTAAYNGGIYYKGNIDGIFGSQLFDALKAFQSKNGLTADGVCGSATYQKLTYSDWLLP